MPTEDQITARESVIQIRLREYAQASRTTGFAITADQLRYQAILELTGNPPPPVEPALAPDTHLDDRYVVIG